MVVTNDSLVLLVLLVHSVRLAGTKSFDLLSDHSEYEFPKIQSHILKFIYEIAKLNLAIANDSVVMTLVRQSSWERARFDLALSGGRSAFCETPTSNIN